MAVSVKKAILWRREVDNHPGMLAETLQPLSEAGADLQVVMAYRYPGGENKAAIELHPVSGKKSVAAAQTAGLAPSSISTLLVEGDNRPGLGHAIAEAIGDAEINMSFVMAQVVGRRYSAVFGFENEADASKAATLNKTALHPSYYERLVANKTHDNLAEWTAYLRGQTIGTGSSNSLPSSKQFISPGTFRRRS